MRAVRPGVETASTQGGDGEGCNAVSGIVAAATGRGALEGAAGGSCAADAVPGWAQRFLTFARAETIEGLNGAKVWSVLERLAVRDKLSASTQNQALNPGVFVEGVVVTGESVGGLDSAAGCWGSPY